jgi:uncharacterized sulfatase
MIYAEAYEHDIADVHQPTKSLQYQIGIEYPWKIILPNPAIVPNRDAELYDLATDPEEIQNLFVKNPMIASDLTQKINSIYKIP